MRMKLYVQNGEYKGTDGVRCVLIEELIRIYNEQNHMVEGGLVTGDLKVLEITIIAMVNDIGDYRVSLGNV